MSTEANIALELFYSYAHKDEKLRNELNKHLYNLRRQGLIHDWYDRDISAGTDWEQAIDDHLNSAKVILLLISPDFMASEYCSSVEMERALERHKAGEARVIPILLKPVDWAGAPFSSLQVLPRNGRAVTSWKDRNAAFAEIAKEIRETLKQLRESSSMNQTLYPAQSQLALVQPLMNQTLNSLPVDTQALTTELTSVWNVPYPRNLRFTDREDILQQLHQMFTKGTANSPKQPIALSGLGGMGKTQIALEYAYRHREDYQVVLWANADSKEVLISELVNFATLLKVPGQHKQDRQYTLAAVKQWLEIHVKWLLILDNIEDLQLAHEYLPATPLGHFLLTTNTQIMHGVARRLDIDKLEPEYGALLLLRRVGLLDMDAPLDRVSESESVQAMEITTMLGGHPLAIDQAGAYIEENGANLHRYPELYTKRRAYLLNTRGSFMADHPQSVTTTLSLSFEKVEQASEAAWELLCCLAFLHPDAIPDELLEQGASQLGEQLQVVLTDGLEFESALGILRTYSLVRRNPDGATLTIHRLVQDVLKESMSEPIQRQWVERIVRAVNHVFPTGEFETWEYCRKYFPQAQNGAILIETWHLAFPEAAQLLYKAGRYLDERGQYPEATALIRQSLTIREQTLGTSHYEVAASLNELAELYLKQGLYAEVEPLLHRALTIREQTQGPNHPDTALSLNNLALLYNYQGRFSESELLYKRALAIHEHTFRFEHPDIVKILGNYVQLLRATNRKGRAAEMEARLNVLRRKISKTKKKFASNERDSF